jgi:hypothetical protein
MSAKRVNKDNFRTQGVRKAAIELLVFVSALLVLILTTANIENYQSPKKVLAAETQVSSNDKFWQVFLTKNPNYIPGWIEIERIDKAKEIDPNYIVTP